MSLRVTFVAAARSSPLLAERFEVVARYGKRPQRNLRALARAVRAADVVVGWWAHLHTLVPWDKLAVLASVSKTSKVLVLHEDTHTGGFGGEIAATIAEEAFEDLDAPPKRIAAPDSPVPFSPQLEKAYIPQVEDVVAGIREVAEY